jgi:hypothetical protein
MTSVRLAVWQLAAAAAARALLVALGATVTAVPAKT